MAEIAVSIVISRLLTFVDKEARLLGGVETQIENIKTELVYIQAFLKDADAQAEQAGVRQVLKIWIRDLRETAYSLEDVLDEYSLDLANPSQRLGLPYKFGRFLQKLKTRHEIASKIREIQKKVVKLKEASSTYGLISSFQQGFGGGSSNTSRSTSTPWHDTRVTSLFLDEAEIVGIESQKIELTSRLVGGTPNRTVISVVGMGGLGKTTLAKKVHDNKELAGHFDCSVWITVSQSFQMEGLLRNMSKKLYQARKEAVPEGIDTMDEYSLITLIREYLQDKRYVVVFDDVWKLDFWGFMKYVLPENKKGSRIMITTRNDGVASSFDYIHKLQPLSPERSWELFCKKAFQDGCPPELEELTHDIIRRCGGLPLAIVAIAGLLSRKEKTVAQWKKFSDTLGSELQNNSQLEGINIILSLSYHDLPCHLKSCFLYLAIFPEDYIIQCGKLTRLWIAEDFVTVRRGVTLEDTAQEFLTELAQRSLIQVSEVDADGKIGSCQVHDLMREIILIKAEDLRFCHTITTGEASNFDGSLKFRRLSIHNSSNNVANGIGKKSHIRSIFLYQSQTFSLETLASKLKLVKVLHLDGAHLDCIPNNIGNFIHLRYLSLRNTKIRMLPRSIGKLQNLQTLDLKYSLVEDLPVEINSLLKLRNVIAFNNDADFSLGLSYVRGAQVKEGIGCLGELQKLHTVEANHGVGVINELGKLRQLKKLGIAKFTKENGVHLCAAITNMNRLKSLFIATLSEDELLDLQYISHPPCCLSKLVLMGPLEKLPDWISKLQSLGTLFLHGSNLNDDPMEVLQALPSLQKLYLVRVSDFEKICFKSTGFQKLKHLAFGYLMGLKRVEIENGTLPQLETLDIRVCPQLEELPPGIRHLTRLTTLEFTNLREELKQSIIPPRGRNYEIVEHIPNVIFHEIKTQSLRELADQYNS